MGEVPFATVAMIEVVVRVALLVAVVSRDEEESVAAATAKAEEMTDFLWQGISRK